MTRAVAAMCVQGVSTRKVTAVVQELCGLDITPTSVSRAATERDEQLSAWRNRPIGEVTHLVLDARYQTPAPQRAVWLEENLPEDLTVLRVPAAHRRLLRTTNGLE